MGKRGSGASSSSAPRTKRPPKATPEEARAQASARQRNLRARRRSVRESGKASAEVRRRELLAQAGGRRFGNYHVYENVEWIARVGSSPSAGGARAPLAGVISNVACQATNRWSVELYRWRIFIYILDKEREVVTRLCGEGALGMTLNFDETPCRMFSSAELGVHSAPTQVRCLQLHGAHGQLYACVPRLRRLSGSTWQHLLAGVGFDSLYLTELCRSSISWRFLLVVVDAAPTNKAAIRGLVAQCESYPRLLVFNNICMAHVLSNATRWALGKGFPFGSFVRLSHIMQARPFKASKELCAEFMGGAPSEVTEASLELGREVWRFVLDRYFSPGGPFGAVRSELTISSRVDLCCRLWPNGLPVMGEQWPTVDGASRADYISAIDMLFRRTVNTPLLSRWYTVEQFAWLLLVVRAFGVLKYIVPDDVRVGYWPGDSPAAMLIDSAAYAAQSQRRVCRALEFIKSEDFASSIFRAALSSIPRWFFARKLYPAEDAPVGNRGVSEAIRCFVDHTNEMLDGRHRVAEWLICREDAHASLRLYVYQALSATAAYLAEKTSPYTTLLWRIVRGDVPAERVSELSETPNCCAASGNEQKIRAALMSLEGESRLVALSDLCATLRACAVAYTAKGGSVNLVCESQFNHLRSLGLKHPYRPPTISTSDREMVLRHVRERHRLWFSRHVQMTYGGLRNMQHLLRRAGPNVNGFTVFCRSTAVPFYVGRASWALLVPETKRMWAAIAEKMNPENARAHQLMLEETADRATAGPLGSTHRWLPICVPDLYEKLTNQECDLRARWTKSAIRLYRASLEAAQVVERPSVAELRRLKSLRVAGDKCGDCASARNAILWATHSLFRCLADAYKRCNGERQGLAVGVVYDDSVMHFDVSIISRSPQRILGFELLPLDWHAQGQAGAVCCPRIARLTVPEIFDGGSICLLDACAKLGRPDRVLFYEKLGVFATDDGWVYQFGAGCEEHALHQNNAGGPRGRVVAAPRGLRTPRLDLAAYRRMFGDDSGDCDLPSGGAVAPDGAASSDEAADDDAPLGLSDDPGSGASSDLRLVRTLRDANTDDVIVVGAAADARMTIEEQDVLLKRVQGVIDCNRYGVAVRLQEGVAVTYWKQSEKLRHWAAYVAACRQLTASVGATAMTSSKSSTLCRHSLAECLDRSRAWQEWHTAWVYGVAPSGPLPPGMILPDSPLAAAHPVLVPDDTSDSDDGSSGDGEIMELASGGAPSSSLAETSSGTFDDGADFGRSA